MFELQHPARILVAKSLTEAHLVASLPEIEKSRRDMKTGWVWYQLPSYPDREVVVAISLGFNQGRLEMIIVSDASPKYGKDWNDWSEEKERQRAQNIGAWLATRGFSAGSYPWGEVWVGYDPKGGFGAASVRLAAQQGVPADVARPAGERRG